uniref:Uncharacterized protein n=1 Tax=Lepeophtheirus salmonis TaxID=72036 RepID=A0A0K2US83_LEPSM
MMGLGMAIFDISRKFLVYGHNQIRFKKILTVNINDYTDNNQHHATKSGVANGQHSSNAYGRANQQNLIHSIQSKIL